MDLQLRNALVDAINAHPGRPHVIKTLTYSADGSGSIEYLADGVWVDRRAPGFQGTRVAIGDEELVRAYLVCQLAGTYAYDATPDVIEIERTYAPVGRPTGKGGRIDVLVREPLGEDGTRPRGYLFIECKAPSKFDGDMRYMDGQLFRLSRQEPVRPRYLVYYTVELKSEGLRERLILIDTETFPEYSDWDDAGQPITDTIPVGYGEAEKRKFANVDTPTEWLQPLDAETSAETFHRLRGEIHDVIWSGGGTNNNEVFVLITKLILCKIFDEKETNPGDVYRFQRRGRADSPEPADELLARLNELYREAEGAYLALETGSQGPAFDSSRIAADKVAYVVGRLEGLSMTENRHGGDLLGEFFEQIVAQDFTQTKGQFFTPVKIVRFMLEISNAVSTAEKVMLHDKDHLGRPRLPYVIDPSCGSGTFLIEYMKTIRARLGNAESRAKLPRRIRESHETWFGGSTGNAWARDFLFGVENNYDLGLAAKVNMVMHGDGSMNTWIKSGLGSFDDYWVDGRHNVLGTRLPAQPAYEGELNEQFDFIISNPPFSLNLSPDEKRRASDVFDVMRSARSEAIFIERWYQLLREGGEFCCVLPEAVLDVATSDSMRRFLLAHFKILAVVSLPYDAFRPFTSTKTAILYARKRTRAEVAAVAEELESLGHTWITAPVEVFQAVFDAQGFAEDPIFMAEPASVGYKRRKGLADLDLPNHLYTEGPSGELIMGDHVGTVLGAWRDESISPSSTVGFRTNLHEICSREGLRLDPKYRWLWDFQRGLVHGDYALSRPLSSVLSILPVQRMRKNELEGAARVVDLELVESLQAIVADEVPELDTLGSDKIVFGECDLAFSKLEPYLAKVIIEPDPAWLGSTEWVRLKVAEGMPVLLIAYLLMLPGLRDGYRRLQGGKRHARLDPNEILELRVQVPDAAEWPDLVAELQTMRTQILSLRSEERSVRAAMDDLFPG